MVPNMSRSLIAVGFRGGSCSTAVSLEPLGSEMATGLPTKHLLVEFYGDLSIQNSDGGGQLLFLMWHISNWGFLKRSPNSWLSSWKIPSKDD